MSKKTMRRYLRKPKKKDNSNTSTNWKALHKKALELTKDTPSDKDPRVQLLRGYEDSEKVLRKLSILGPADLKREFGE